MIKGDGCIECGLCEEVCPTNAAPKLNYPLKAFAAWSMNQETRQKSASGGIATTLYTYSLENDISFVGAYLDDKFECRLKIGDSTEDIIEFQSSKYTHSYADDIYKQVGEQLKNGIQVLFVGLPCQVAALNNYLNLIRVDQKNLIKIDIICHGTPNPNYLIEHINKISKTTMKLLDTVILGIITTEHKIMCFHCILTVTSKSTKRVLMKMIYIRLGIIRL